MRKSLATLLMVLLINLTCAVAAFAAPQSDRDARALEKVKEKIALVSPRPRARIQVKLRSGRKLKGYVTETTNDDFLLSDSRTSTSERIRYADVRQVKGASGEEHSGLRKASSIVAIAAGGLLIVLVVAVLRSPN